ncbi:unnamed protein product, partial [Allacma fusca]
MVCTKASIIFLRMKKKEPFHLREARAELIFGTTRERPQETDKDFLRNRRRGLYSNQTVRHSNPLDVLEWEFDADHLKPQCGDAMNIKNPALFVNNSETMNQMIQTLKQAH